jgi:glycosyltransferase involved in cell wall biosynthesis
MAGDVATPDERSAFRVLLVAAATSTTGGGERHVADLLRRLPADGVEVGLACPAGGDLSALAESLGIAVFAANVASGFSPASTSALRRAIEAFAPDVVHAHGSRAAMFARLADPRPRARVVYTVHGIHIDKAGSPARRAALLRLERRLRYRTAAWITVCGADLDKGERLKILRRERSHVVHNGIAMPPPLAAPMLGDFRAELGISRETPLALSIGRLHEQKDQRTLLDAWAGVRGEFPDAVLALVGSGEMEGELRVRSVALSLGDSVRFVPPRRDLAPVYADSDLFVLSSRWEGLPYVVLEAMAYELPVVSTAVDGIPEAVMNEDTGLLVPARDPVSLAAAMRRLFRDPELRASMGASGRARVERHFTLEEMVEGVLRVYGEVLSAG